MLSHFYFWHTIAYHALVILHHWYLNFIHKIMQMGLTNNYTVYQKHPNPPTAQFHLYYTLGSANFLKQRATAWTLTCKSLPPWF